MLIGRKVLISEILSGLLPEYLATEVLSGSGKTPLQCPGQRDSYRQGGSYPNRNLCRIFSEGGVYMFFMCLPCSQRKGKTSLMKADLLQLGGRGFLAILADSTPSCLGGGISMTVIAVSTSIALVALLVISIRHKHS